MAVRLTDYEAQRIRAVLTDLDQQDKPYIQPILESINFQLRPGSQHAERRLLDQIVDALSMTNARMVIGGATLRVIRKMVLNPGELAKVEGKLDKALSCVHCGKPIHNGEVVTYNGSHECVCVNCAIPTYTSCPRCQSTLGLTRAFTASLEASVKKCACKDMTDEQIAAVKMEREQAAIPAVRVREREMRRVAVPRPTRVLHNELFGTGGTPAWDNATLTNTAAPLRTEEGETFFELPELDDPDDNGDAD